MICFEMDTRPSSFLLFLAIAMCSILCIFSVSVLLIFHCCRVKDLSHTISEKARASVMYARNSIFGVSGIELDEDDEYRDQLEAQWEAMDPRENSTQSIPNAQKNLLLPSRWTKWGGRHSLAPTHCV